MKDSILGMWLIVGVCAYIVGSITFCSWAINMVFFGINAALYKHYQPGALPLAAVLTLVIVTAAYALGSITDD